MKRIILILSLLILYSFNLIFSQANLTAEKIGDKIEFRIDGKLITSYVFSEHEKYPFFFPVNGPSGSGVTSMRNSLYPHHTSLFFGCDRVNEGNYWQEGLERGQILSIREDILKAEGSEVFVENECIWRRPGAEAPVKDTRLIKVSAPSPEKYQIDFEITMQMLSDVTIEKTNHSLFSARMDPDLTVNNGGTMVNAEGETGETGTWGKSSAWLDYHGKRLGKTEGLAILQHPSNKWFPSPWFTRDYGFFSPTPMYWPENDEFIELKKGEQVKLRYRVIVHSGDHIEAGIAEEFEKYTAE
ncbi:MAG: PmoA family protein [Bacteroidales bacterium]